MAEGPRYEIPSFEIGKAFPSNDPKSVSLIRFLLASQCLAAIARLPEVVPDTPAYEESRHYLMLLALGAAHEAGNAFAGAYKHGVFDRLKAVDDEEMNERLKLLVRETDRDNPKSLQSKLVTHGRNKFAFHWDMKEVKKSLSKLSGATLPAWSGGEDETVMSTAIPIVERLTLKSMELRAGSVKKLNGLMEQVARFQGALFHVAHGAYTVALADNRKAAGVGGKKKNA
ncbi:MAG TPA: hypothetical protein VNO50_14140 [Pyrinomonadaceae bacterium]|nr:hypothetical protein [Pyrinomonadaceae bacterium]